MLHLSRLRVDERIVTAPGSVLLSWLRDHFAVATALFSLLLSLWAIYLDPVISHAGVGVLQAAVYFGDGQWRAGLETADSPLYALILSGLRDVTGLSPAHTAHALGAGCFVALTLGFVAVVSALGGGYRARALALLLVLLYPALNGFRSYLSADPAYWACQVWSIAGCLQYMVSGRRRSLLLWLAAGGAALLFSLEALVFLVVVPLWLTASAAGGGFRGSAAKTAVVAAGAGVLLCYASWRQALQDGSSPGALLAGPFDHLAQGWQALGVGLRFKLEALQGGFLDEFSRSYDDAALLATIGLLVAGGLVKTLGLLYTVLSAYAVANARNLLAPHARRAWTTFAFTATAALLVPACTGFSVEPRHGMVAALILLAAVPLALARYWRDGDARFRLMPAVLAVVAAAGLAGLDLRTDRHHLKEAGSWLRANAPAGFELYSNSRVVAYYAGSGADRRASRYTWRHAMNTVHRDRWREYDYLALVIDHADRHREGVLQHWLELEPVHVTANDHGDRVLIFRTD